MYTTYLDLSIGTHNLLFYKQAKQKKKLQVQIVSI